jgi:hypothetical protein
VTSRLPVTFHEEEGESVETAFEGFLPDVADLDHHAVAHAPVSSRTKRSCRTWGRASEPVSSLPEERRW